MKRIIKGMHLMCAAKCGLSYRDCLLRRQREDLKENGKLMSKCMKRNLGGLFSFHASTRIHVHNFGAMGMGLSF